MVWGVRVIIYIFITYNNHDNSNSCYFWLCDFLALWTFFDRTSVRKSWMRTLRVWKHVRRLQQHSGVQSQIWRGYERLWRRWRHHLQTRTRTHPKHQVSCLVSSSSSLESSFVWYGFGFLPTIPVHNAHIEIGTVKVESPRQQYPKYHHPTLPTGMAGRTSLAKSVNMTDPMCLQTIKDILGKRDVKTVKDISELQVQDASRPFLIKKGRHILRALAKQESQRTLLENTVQEFRKTTMGGSADKNVWPGQALVVLYYFVKVRFVTWLDLNKTQTLTQT